MFKLLGTLVPMPLSENLTAKVCSLFSCTRKIHKRQSREQSKSPRLDFRSLVRRRWKCLSPFEIRGQSLCSWPGRREDV